jgi:hypothetical protein
MVFSRRDAEAQRDSGETEDIDLVAGEALDLSIRLDRDLALELLESHLRPLINSDCTTLKEGFYAWPMTTSPLRLRVSARTKWHCNPAIRAKLSHSREPRPAAAGRS